MISPVGAALIMTTESNIVELSEQLRAIIKQLRSEGRNDLILSALGVPLLEELRIEAARGKLSRLLITRNWQFILLDYDRKEIEMQPVHKAVYLLFLAHPEGIVFNISPTIAKNCCATTRPRPDSWRQRRLKRVSTD